ncbi:CmpA/NrtA family ABC transporter substrate-binding protein [Leeia oryzae]|uniref:CmpA/NrtA family ABC transporter substrate-binding protein n=1 Tax=Leeia oryzae TaxID=356662 RepID=UPI0003A7DDA0|nr:CmpA/NrtA family ABC transporter substrate-binding protein [Leeia oryzae]
MFDRPPCMQQAAGDEAGGGNCSPMVWAHGSDAPEKPDLNIGFIPLTDCAPLIVAVMQQFDKKYGLNITLRKEASWAGVRDKLMSGELDAAHVLYGLVYGLQMGIGGPIHDMAVLMTLNQNGQGITLTRQLLEDGVRDGASLAQKIHERPKAYCFAQTFPTGTHAMWLYYWLASLGVNPLTEVNTVVIPPPEMTDNLRAGHMHGFCAGDPWHARAIHDKVGFTVATSQDIWPDHPDKVLGTTRAFVQQYPNTARALVMCMLDACRYIDSRASRAGLTSLMARPAFVNVPEADIAPRFMGDYDDGLGKQWHDPHHMKFFDEGRVNFPYLSDGMWFMTQHRRWGMLKTDPDYLAVATRVNQIGLYAEAASQLKVPVPADPMRSSRLMDGRVWDGRNPQDYAAGFEIRAG